MFPTNPTTILAGAGKAMLAFALGLAPLLCQAGNDPSNLFTRGVHYYEQSRYDEARSALEQAVEQAPHISTYHHMLGRVYGRLAERAGLFRAISLSRLTLEQLKTAVALDDSNISAMKDLIEYYRRAPGFLGGSLEKARELSERVEFLESGDISSKETVESDDKPT